MSLSKVSVLSSGKWGWAPVPALRSYVGHVSPQCLSEGASEKTHPKLGPEKEQDRGTGRGRPRGAGEGGRRPAPRLSPAPEAREGRPSEGPGCSRPRPHPPLRSGAARRASNEEAEDAPHAAALPRGGPRTRPAGASPGPEPRRAPPRPGPPAAPFPARAVRTALTCRRRRRRRRPAPAPAVAAAVTAAAAARVGAPPRTGSCCAGGGGGAAAGAPRWPPGPARSSGPRAPRPGGREAPTPRPPFGRRVPPPCTVFTRNAENAQASHSRRPPSHAGVGASGQAPSEREQETKPFQNTFSSSKPRTCLDAPGAAPPPEENTF